MKYKIIFNPFRNEYRKVVPCYCGGEVHIKLLDRPRKKEQIVNCFPFKLTTKDGWVSLGKMEL